MLTQHPLHCLTHYRYSGILFLIFLFWMVICQPIVAEEKASPATTATPETPAQSSATEAGSASCTLSPIIVPMPPDDPPGYTELDYKTGLHVTGRMQVIDVESYRLEVAGMVEHPLSLSYDELRCMPKREVRPELICPGFFKDVATWVGASLQHVLKLAGIQEQATAIKLISADGYAASVLVSEAFEEHNFLAYEWEGEPIPILHGFPVRVVFPGMQGNKWVKWLVKIEVY